MICNAEYPNLFGWGIVSISLVFSPGGHASTNMALLFIQLQNLPDLCVQRRIVGCKPLGNVFMYRRFGDVVMFCGRTDGCSGFNDVHSQFAGSFLQRFFQ